VIEVNEAFAAVTLTSLKLLEADPDRMNVKGGAVAMGHPIGASGARLVTTLVYELIASGKRYGAAGSAAYPSAPGGRRSIQASRSHPARSAAASSTLTCAAKVGGTPAAVAAEPMRTRRQATAPAHIAIRHPARTPYGP
jgi:hypothetical protein